MSHTHNQRSYARHHVGLIVTLIGLMSGVALMAGPARIGSAQTVAASWSITGNLNTARVFHTATLLPSGKVLVAGGNNNNGNGPNTAELYDPVTGTSSITGNLNTGRSAHTATILPNGKVLVAGGTNFPEGELNSAELYDPATGTWSSTGNLNAARWSHRATLLPSGKVLVAGGCVSFLCNTTNSAELYDPTTGIWSYTGNLISANDLGPATLLPNGKVLLVGFGAELYDPATGTWSTTGSPVLGNGPVTLLPNGNVLMSGGNSGNSAELYNPATGTWSITASLNTARGGNHTATLLRNGKVLVAGGGDPSIADENGASLNSSELYDPATGTWSTTASLNTARGAHTATLLPNGKVLVAGGSDDCCSPMNSAELYDPGPNQIDDAQFFVHQHYRDFLNREPDPSGLAFWSDEITSCGTDQGCIEAKRINVSAAFFLSIEFQETGYLVYRIYKSSYGDVSGTPVPVMLNEFLPDTRKIGQGVIVNQAGWETVLENNKQAFMAEFVQRSRFTSAYPTAMTPAEFVDELFANAGVTPSANDRTAAVNEFGSATTTADVAARARALRRVAENSTFAQQEFNRAFVLMQYFGYLRRNPNDPPELTLDFQGYSFWLSKLNQFNGNFANAEMVKAFLVSTEYRQRFGQP
jgi:hypothetical protein